MLLLHGIRVRPYRRLLLLSHLCADLQPLLQRLSKGCCKCGGIHWYYHLLLLAGISCSSRKSIHQGLGCNDSYYKSNASVHVPASVLATASVLCCVLCCTCRLTYASSCYNTAAQCLAVTGPATLASRTKQTSSNSSSGRNNTI